MTDAEINSMDGRAAMLALRLATATRSQNKDDIKIQERFIKAWDALAEKEKGE